jgi:hypothetical protein
MGSGDAATGAGRVGGSGGGGGGGGGGGAAGGGANAAGNRRRPPVTVEMVATARTALERVAKEAGPDAVAVVQGKYFVKTMEKVLQHGEGHVAKEAARLDKMLADPHVRQSKKASFEMRRGVLRKFSLAEESSEEVGSRIAEV